MLAPWRIVLAIIFTLIYGLCIGNEPVQHRDAALTYTGLTLAICSLLML